MLLSLFFILGTAHIGWSQEGSDESVEYDFEEDVIAGQTKSPEELYIQSIKGTKAGSLITIRKDFQTEIVKSAEGI
jgi:hypothetical protein